MAAKWKEYMRQLSRMEGNAWCADCETRDPKFICLTLGTFVCKTCAHAHRGRNRKVKSLDEDDVTEEDLKRMEQVGNDRCNRKYLAKFSERDFEKPTPGDSNSCTNFIWLKYEGEWALTKNEKDQRKNAYMSFNPRRAGPYGSEGPLRDNYYPSAPPPPAGPGQQESWSFSAANFSESNGYRQGDRYYEGYRDERGYGPQSSRGPPGAPQAYLSPPRGGQPYQPYQRSAYEAPAQRSGPAFAGRPPPRDDPYRNDPYRSTAQRSDPYHGDRYGNDHYEQGAYQRERDPYRGGPPAALPADEYRQEISRRHYDDDDEYDNDKRSTKDARRKKKSSKKTVDSSDESESEEEVSSAKAKSKKKKSSSKRTDEASESGSSKKHKHSKSKKKAPVQESESGDSSETESEDSDVKSKSKKRGKSTKSSKKKSTKKSTEEPRAERQIEAASTPQQQMLVPLDYPSTIPGQPLGVGAQGVRPGALPMDMHHPGAMPMVQGQPPVMPSLQPPLSMAGPGFGMLPQQQHANNLLNLGGSQQPPQFPPGYNPNMNGLNSNFGNMRLQ
mmetsp:Transcript_12222/g.37276  ORF Transcript_12222/g.37276 Transcript_12222/m.37276 type:complete len:556 (+) Transcript_12222:52-1719(+)